MPWARRAPEKEGSDEDAELRDLMKEYSRVHRHSNAQAKEESEALTAKLSLNPFKNLANQSTTPSKTKTESPANELIQGQAISYTRKEALLYANEEPCDTWRHFDVLHRRTKANSRNGFIIIYRYIWAQITIGMDTDGHLYHTGMNYDSALVRRVCHL